MKALRNLVITLGSLGLAACSSMTTTPQPKLATLEDPASIQPQPFILRGSVVAGSGVQTITPCGSQQQFRLQIPKSLQQSVESVEKAPYEPVYGELVGYLLPPSQTGYNGDYAARFVVTQINTLNGKEPNRCKFYPLSTRSFGSTPETWSLQFTQPGLVLHSASGQQQTFTIKELKTSANARHYTLDKGDLRLTAERCENKNAGAVYGWHAELKVADKNYLGCAVLGNSDASLEWAGVYYASSTQNQGFTVSMLLGDDHTAVTRYSYSNGDPDVVEKGFWQVLNTEQIQVIMTRHQQQYLVTQRIFGHDDSTLIAKKEKVGNTIYPIANGGLVLYKDYHDSFGLEQKPQSKRLYSSSGKYEERVDQTLREYQATHRFSLEGHHYRWLTYDLNGDDNPELVVKTDICEHNSCTMLLFSNVNHQWKFNSKFSAMSPIQVSHMSNHGWRNLLVIEEGSKQWQQLQMKSGHYQLDKSPLATVPSPDVTLFSDDDTVNSGAKL